MKLTTKFNCGDKFFALDGGKILEHTVRHFITSTSKYGEDAQKTDVSYFPVDKAKELAFQENQMFKSRRALLKSL